MGSGAADSRREPGVPRFKLARTGPRYTRRIAMMARSGHTGELWARGAAARVRTGVRRLRDSRLHANAVVYRAVRRSGGSATGTGCSRVPARADTSPEKMGQLPHACIVRGPASSVHDAGPRS